MRALAGSLAMVYARRFNLPLSDPRVADQTELDLAVELLAHMQIDEVAKRAENPDRYDAEAEAAKLARDPEAARGWAERTRERAQAPDFRDQLAAMGLKLPGVTAPLAPEPLPRATLHLTRRGPRG